MRSRLTTSSLLVAGALILGVSCSNNASDTQPSPTLAPTTSTIPVTTTTVTGTASTVTTIIAPTTTAPPDTTLLTSDDAAVLTGSDWPAIIQILSRRRDTLFAEPDADPAKIAEICAPGEGSCSRGLSTQVPDLVAKGYRIVGADPTTVLPADVVIENIENGQTIETARIVTVIVVIQQPVHSGQIIDATGVVQADLDSGTPEGENGRSRTTLVRPEVGSEWRILEQSDAGDVPA